MKYINRIVDDELQERLERTGAVLIDGPRWCGKTTTGRRFAKSILYMQDPGMRSRIEAAAELAPRTLLEGETPRLIDEWQIGADYIWDSVRFECDMRGEPGQFILTGSATPIIDMSGSHPGIGRIARMRMRPMTLTEAGYSSGGYSLKSLFEGEELEPIRNSLELEDVLSIICRGGWPSVLGKSERAALGLVRDYVTGLVESEIFRAEGKQRDPMRMRALLRSLSRHVATQAPNTILLDDVNAKESVEMSRESISAYLRALERAFVIEDVQAWNPSLKSKTAIRTKPTRFFVDPSLAVAAQSLGPKDLMNDLLSAGYLFENLCMRDLQVYAQALDGDVFHYRDKSGREVDAVIHLYNGQWALIEVKMGFDSALAAAENLVKLAQDIRQDSMGAPAFLMVLTAVGVSAVKLPNGVHIVPIGCLSL